MTSVDVAVDIVIDGTHRSRRVLLQSGQRHPVVCEHQSCAVADAKATRVGPGPPIRDAHGPGPVADADHLRLDGRGDLRRRKTILQH